MATPAELSEKIEQIKADVEALASRLSAGGTIETSDLDSVSAALDELNVTVQETDPEA